MALQSKSGCEPKTIGKDKYMRTKLTDSSSIDLKTLRQEFEKLRASLGDATDKLGEGAHDALNQISDYLNHDTLSDRLASVEDQLSTLGARLKDSGKEAVDRLELEVMDRPFISLAAAFGIGLLAASLIRRG